MERSFEVSNNAKMLNLVEAGPSYDQNLVCLENLGQNIGNKVEGLINIGKDKKTLIFGFAYILTASA